GLAVARVDDHTGPDDLPGEDRVDALCHRQDGPGAGGEDRAHIRSSMSSARVSASGPTTTWMTVPWAMTPRAPAALSAAWSTFEPSSLSVRSRVMHGSISTTLSAPPRPARICSALDAMVLPLESVMRQCASVRVTFASPRGVSGS